MSCAARIAQFVGDYTYLNAVAMGIRLHAQFTAATLQTGAFAFRHTPGAQVTFGNCKRTVNDLSLVRRAFLLFRTLARIKENIEVHLSCLGGTGNKNNGNGKRIFHTPNIGANYGRC